MNKICVPSYTPIYVREMAKPEQIADNQLYTLFVNMEDISFKYGDNIWHAMSNEETVENEEKFYCNVSGIECWTENGFIPLTRIVRRMMNPGESIKRIAMQESIIDVTSNGENADFMICPFDDDVRINCEGYLSIHHFYDDGQFGYPGEYSIRSDMTTKNMRFASIYYYILQDFENCISYEHDKKDFRIIVKPTQEEYEDNSVSIVYDIDYSGYVYEIMTSCGHYFSGGIGFSVITV